MNQAFDKAYGNPLIKEYDYLETTRNLSNPSADPIQIEGKGIHRSKVKVWPLQDVMR